MSPFIKIVSVILTVLMFTSCSKRISVQEFLDEVNKDEDFVQSWQDPVYRLSCVYAPPEKMALAELRGELSGTGKLSKERFEHVKKKFSSASYFTLKIGLTNGADILQAAVRSKQEYSRLVNDITFNFGSYLYFLTPQQDTIRPSIFDLQRSYGMSPDLTVLLAFPSEQIANSNTERLELNYRDPYFGIPEKVVFIYNPKDLRKELPDINFDQNE